MTENMFLRCLSDIKLYFCRKIDPIFVKIAFFVIFGYFLEKIFEGKVEILATNQKLGLGLFSSLKSLNQTRLVFSLEFGHAQNKAPGEKMMMSPLTPTRHDAVN